MAAGNATPSLFGPGGYANVNAVIVGASGRQDEVAWYSSTLAGAKWGLIAPGGDARGPDGTPSCAGTLATDCVVSTGWFAGKQNQYADDEGTSMATPEVAGAIAMVMAQTPGMSATAAVQRVISTATKLSCGDGCKGRLDVAAAVGAPVAATPPGNAGPAGAAGSSPATVAPAPPAPAPVAGGGPAAIPVSPGLASTTVPTTPQPAEPGAPLALGDAPQTAAGEPIQGLRPVSAPGHHVAGVAIAIAFGALALVVAEAFALSRSGAGSPFEISRRRL